MYVLLSPQFDSDDFAVVLSMKVVIEARLPDPFVSGGVAQAITSLAIGLSGLGDSSPQDQYIFVTLESAGDWLGRHVAGPCRVHAIPRSWKERVSGSVFGSAARQAWNIYRGLTPTSFPTIATSDGLAERLGADLIHFPTQNAYLTGLPNIYQPHDLQHLHLPEFFDPEQLAWRKLAYPKFCDRADLVLVESSWTKRDIAENFGIGLEKIAVCTFPPATGGYRAPNPDEIAAFRKRSPFQDFIFYPAQTWPHKNHIRLLQALAILRDKFGLVVPLVCSGRTTAFVQEIEKQIDHLGLRNQVQFLGFVDEITIMMLYRLCTAVVVPTKFESVSFPVWEAFQAGKAVACSNVTSLPEQVGQAGLLFDADDAHAMALAIKTLWEQPELRETLGRQGRERLRSFSLERTIRHIRALYRRVAGCSTPEDEALLHAPVLI
jgi:glycosyltransferase involved in cell wall biosynthesis